MYKVHLVIINLYLQGLTLIVVFFVFSSLETGPKTEQAGAELCQAQYSLSYPLAGATYPLAWSFILSQLWQGLSLS